MKTRCFTRLGGHSYEELLLSMRDRKETKEGDALEEVFLGDPMLGHASLARVGGASDAPA